MTVSEALLIAMVPCGEIQDAGDGRRWLCLAPPAERGRMSPVPLEQRFRACSAKSPPLGACVRCRWRKAFRRLFKGGDPLELVGRRQPPSDPDWPDRPGEAGLVVGFD